MMCNSTWSNHGYVAAYGVVAVESWEGGQVSDATVHSKPYSICKDSESTIDKSFMIGGRYTRTPAIQTYMVPLLSWKLKVH